MKKNKNNISALKSVRKYFFLVSRGLIELLQKRLSDHNKCRLQNLANKIRYINDTFGYDPEMEYFYVKNESQKIFFPHSTRGFRIFANGIIARGEVLAKSYFVDLINFDNSDIVIDCGANTGDLMIFLKSKIREHNYHAFEPSSAEFQCIRYNYPTAHCYDIALSRDSEEHVFYIASETADSSLIQPPSYTATKRVRTSRLDDVKALDSIKSIKLLKIEAEGAEPEVLLGAEQTLKKCIFIAVDGGPERGILQESTFKDVETILIGSGFSLVKSDHSRSRALFARADSHL